MTRAESQRRELQAASGGFVQVPYEVLESFGRRSHLAVAWAAIAREVWQGDGKSPIPQRRLVERHYLRHGRAASTFWRHRRELIDLGLLKVARPGFGEGPTWGPGAVRVLSLVDFRRSSDRRRRLSRPREPEVPPGTRGASPRTIEPERGPPLTGDEVAHRGKKLLRKLGR